MNKENKRSQMNWTIFWMCAGFLIVFCAACMINKDATYNAVVSAFNFIGTYFGSVIQVSMLVFLAVAIAVAVSKYGNVRIGGKDAKPETKGLSWFAIITTTMLAGGGVFFAAGEPFAHFLNIPAHFPNVVSGTKEAARYALAQSYLDWGFIVWGAASFCLPFLVYAKEVRHLPMRPSSMLDPVLGEKAVKGVPGKIFDGFVLISTAAGTIGPTGFLGLQMAFALNRLWGVPNTVGIRVVIIMISAGIFLLGACTGLKKGMDWLSKLTVYLSGVMLISVVCFGCGIFVFDSYIDSFGVYLREFFNMALSRTDTAWVNSWTLFYEVWFLGFGPSMAVLIISLSKGRTLREIILKIAVICPILTNLWFDLLGSTTIWVELGNPGLLSTVYNDSGMEAVFITMLQNINGSAFLIPLALVLIVLFLVTTGAGVAYSMSVQCTNRDGEPYVWVRALFSLLIGGVAAVLVWVGADDAMNTIQKFMVVSGLPVLAFFLIMVPGAFKAAKGIWKCKEFRVVKDGEEEAEASQ